MGDGSLPCLKIWIPDDTWATDPALCGIEFETSRRRAGSTSPSGSFETSQSSSRNGWGSAWSPDASRTVPSERVIVTEILEAVVVVFLDDLGHCVLPAHNRQGF